jgi:hypothetical protein
MRIKRILAMMMPQVFVAFFRKMKSHIHLEYAYGDPGVSIFTLIWLWKNGFHSWHKELFKINKNTIHQYLSEKDHYDVHPINGAYSALIDNKAFLPLIIDCAPSVYIVFENGLERFRKGIQHDELFSELRNYLSGGGEIVIKPLSQEGGAGFELIKNKDHKDVIGHRILTKQSFIIQSRVIQHEYANTIYPDSANTIRLVLFRDVGSRRIKIAGASHRFGTDNSKPVDNLGKWGMLTAIDIETGRLGISFVYRGKDFAGWHENHPNTGAPVMNTFIPGWKEKTTNILEIFDQISWFEYGGLDVVFTEDSFTILEINSMPHIDMVQAFKPYLADPSLKEFFISKGLKLKRERV